MSNDYLKNSLDQDLISRRNKYKALSLRTKKQRRMKNLLYYFYRYRVLLVIIIFLFVIISIIATIVAAFNKKDVDISVDDRHAIVAPSTTETVSTDTKDYDEVVSDYVDKMNTDSISTVLNSYQNLAIVKCDGYINFRSEPNENNTRSIIGLVNNGAAVDIIDFDVKENNIYAKVKSGGMTGYVAKKFLITGENAKAIAKNDIKLRAIVLVDKLRMRSAPTTEGNTEIGTTYKGERYVCVERVNDEWVKVIADNLDNYSTAYINANPKYLTVELCLNEARTQNLKNDVINYYNNIGVSIARDYVNIRKTAKSNGTIVGKLPGKAGCEILGESGSFYKIKSGIVTGYVSKQYIATGKKAEDLAIQYADLRAIVKIAAMKVRTGPDTKYKQWTRVTKEETYIVLNQLDGWVEIEIDGGENNNSNKGYISTANNYVEVRYALDQAVPFVQVTSSKTTSLRNKIKDFAVKYIGGKYVWGGNSLSSGTDCSGFVHLVYKNFGVTLPRVSREQAKQGVAVKSANKKVGDLIFYSNSSGVIDHVAIYIGNNQIVHAASSRTGIRISAWNYREPVAIRNVLGNK